MWYEPPADSLIEPTRLFEQGPNQPSAYLIPDADLVSRDTKNGYTENLLSKCCFISVLPQDTLPPLTWNRVLVWTIFLLKGEGPSQVPCQFVRELGVPGWRPCHTDVSNRSALGAHFLKKYSRQGPLLLHKRIVSEDPFVEVDRLWVLKNRPQNN